jgi:hypothetical protein
MNTEVPRLKIDIEPRRILITSEPFVLYTPFGYQPVVEVLEVKTKRTYLLSIAARSLSQPLEQFRIENNGYMTGVEVWIRKKSTDRKSPYIVED